MKSVAKKVIELIAEQAGLRPEQIELEKRLADFEFDQFDCEEILLWLEEQHGIKIDTADEERFSSMTVEDIIDLVKEKVASKGATEAHQ